jgi:2C-methyl-D-erythritol 2,4-cyclodiphosphate synthase
MGINTYSYAEKRALLDAIISAKDKPGILGQGYWPGVQDTYPGASQDTHAEEIYCMVVERSWTRRNLDQTIYDCAWQDSVIDKTTPLQAWELAQVAQNVAQGLRENTRTIQIVPATDHELFRQKESRSRMEQQWHELAERSRYTP